MYPRLSVQNEDESEEEARRPLSYLAFPRSRNSSESCSCYRCYNTAEHANRDEEAAYNYSDEQKQRSKLRQKKLERLERVMENLEVLELIEKDMSYELEEIRACQCDYDNSQQDSLAYSENQGAYDQCLEMEKQLAEELEEIKALQLLRDELQLEAHKRMNVQRTAGRLERSEDRPYALLESDSENERWRLEEWEMLRSALQRLEEDEMMKAEEQREMKKKTANLCTSQQVALEEEMEKEENLRLVERWLQVNYEQLAEEKRVELLSAQEKTLEESMLDRLPEFEYESLEEREKREREEQEKQDEQWRRFLQHWKEEAEKEKSAKKHKFSMKQHREKKRQEKKEKEARKVSDQEEIERAILKDDIKYEKSV